MAPTTLVLWDVDHTLVETRGVGKELFARAFTAVTGVAMREQAQVCGRTEPLIFADTLRLHGLEPSQERLAAFTATLTEQYESEQTWLARQGRALPGAQKALAALARDSAVVQSVLTGNVRGVAEVKLRVFGLDRRLDLDVGAYGSDDESRSALAHIARARAGARYRTSFAAENTWIVGDTPADVSAGLEAGVQVAGVASGSSSMSELR